MSELSAHLTSAFIAARDAARARATTEDGGSCNFDEPFLYAKRGLRAATVEAAAKAAGITVRRYDSSWWRGWMVHVTEGVGARRTRMAEAAAEALQEAGWDATVYYQLD